MIVTKAVGQKQAEALHQLHLDVVRAEGAVKAARSLVEAAVSVLLADCEGRVVAIRPDAGEVDVDDGSTD